MKKTIFSGIQPSGNLHIGNYIGAIKQWVNMQNNPETEYDFIFCVVDLHAITVPQDPKVLKEKILELASLYIACGIDPRKSTVFVQSENPDHSYLAWMFDCITPMGWLYRMTQFKDKSKKLQVAEQSLEQMSVSVGLFNYPPLMAADILLYDTHEVPVGNDQKQHIELTRDIAMKFNNTFGEVFVLPEPRIQEEEARIMSLQAPDSKMSKSDKDPSATINLLDEPEIVIKKVKRAVTDSNSSIDAERIEKSINSDYAPDGLTNLLTINAAIKNKPFKEVLYEKHGMQYGKFKEILANDMVDFLQPIQKRYKEIRDDRGELERILSEGSSRARERSATVLLKARDAMGLGR